MVNNAITKESITSLIMSDLNNATITTSNSNCLSNILTLTPPATTVFNYEVFSGLKYVNLKYFITSPSCSDYSMTSTHTLKCTYDGTATSLAGPALPGFITYMSTYINIDSIDVNEAMEYHISVVGAIPSKGLTAETFYIINVTNPCPSGVLQIAKTEYFFFVMIEKPIAYNFYLPNFTTVNTLHSQCE